MRIPKQCLHLVFVVACSGQTTVDDDRIDGGMGTSGTGGFAGNVGTGATSGSTANAGTSGTGGFAGTSASGGFAGTSASGSGGFAGTLPGDCYFGTAPSPSSTIVGSGFDDWNGQAVDGCYLAAQSFPSGCAKSVIVDGRFSLTASTCTGTGWDLKIGSGARQLRCSGGGVVTPRNCWCGGGVAGGPGLGCDAGADAALSDGSADAALSD